MFITHFIHQDVLYSAVFCPNSLYVTFITHARERTVNVRYRAVEKNGKSLDNHKNIQIFVTIPACLFLACLTRKQPVSKSHAAMMILVRLSLSSAELSRKIMYLPSTWLCASRNRNISHPMTMKGAAIQCKEHTIRKRA